jgi:hypothetical protein
LLASSDRCGDTKYDAQRMEPLVSQCPVSKMGVVTRPPGVTACRGWKELEDGC